MRLLTLGVCRPPAHRFVEALQAIVQSKPSEPLYSQSQERPEILRSSPGLLSGAADWRLCIKV